MNPTNAHEDHNGWQLHRSDAEALEALIHSGFDFQRVEPGLRDRADRVATLLGLLDSSHPPARSDGALIDATLARVGKARSGSSSTDRDGQVNLSLDDEDALELLVGNGFRPERVPSGVRARARRHASILNLLDTPVAVGSAESLVATTLARVQQTVDTQESRLRLQDRPNLSTRLRLGDLISVAAMLLLAGSVLIPMVGAMRDVSRRSTCTANMAQAGLGFGLYAGDYKDSLPLASASKPGDHWWSVGQAPEHSNSANLFTLTRTGYSSVQDLACPGNPNACRERAAAGAFDWRSIDQVSYSYQNMFARERPKWSGTLIVTLMADRSPIIPLAIQGRKINPLQNSLQHDGRGQAVLKSDRSVQWRTSPVLANGDNMFLPRPLEELIARLQQLYEADPLKGTETPAGADDVFLAP